MFHLIWYVLIGLISGFIGKTVMHVHMTMFWTAVLGIIGSIMWDPLESTCRHASLSIL